MEFFQKAGPHPTPLLLSGGCEPSYEAGESKRGGRPRQRRPLALNDRLGMVKPRGVTQIQIPPSESKSETSDASTRNSPRGP